MKDKSDRSDLTHSLRRYLYTMTEGRSNHDNAKQFRLFAYDSGCSSYASRDSDSCANSYGSSGHSQCSFDVVKMLTYPCRCTPESNLAASAPKCKVHK